MQKNASIK